MLGLPVELVCLCILALLLRSFRLTDESLWIDEQFMVQMATHYTLGELIFEVPMFEPHPPLFNVFMWFWVDIGGSTALWMRSTSVMFSVLTVPVLYFLARRLFSRDVAALTSLLFVISPFQIWHAQDARMYALLVLATVSSWYLLFSLKDRRRGLTLAAYLLTAVFLGYTHVYGLFIIFSQFLAAVWWLWRTNETTSFNLRWILGTYLTVGLLIAPWIGILLRRVFVPDPTFDDPAGWLVPPGSVDIIETVRIHALGATRSKAPYDHLPEAPALLTIVLIVPFLFVIGGWFLEAIREHESELVVILLWIAIPVVLPFLLSYLVQPMYELRYTIVAAPAFLMVIALGISLIQSMPRRVILIVLIVSTMAWPLVAFYDQPQKDQWSEAADVTAEYADDATLIIIAPGWTNPSFQYYYGDRPGDLIEIYAGSPQASYNESIEHREQVILVASYLDDRQAVVYRTELAMDRPPDHNHSLVNIDVHVWN